jgi:hypothetical protein
MQVAGREVTKATHRYRYNITTSKWIQVKQQPGDRIQMPGVLPV